MKLIEKHWKIISRNRRNENSKRLVTNLELHLYLLMNLYVIWLMWHNDVTMCTNVWSDMFHWIHLWRWKIVSFVFFILICVLMILVLALTVFSILYRRAQEPIQEPPCTDLILIRVMRYDSYLMTIFSGK